MLLVKLALRYALEPDQRRCNIVLNCVRELIRQGANPLQYDPSPMRIVADFCGGAFAEKSQAFFRELVPFFACNSLLNDTVKLVALLGGYDVRKITNWADIMDLEELTNECTQNMQQEIV